MKKILVSLGFFVMAYSFGTNCFGNFARNVDLIVQAEQKGFAAVKTAEEKCGVIKQAIKALFAEVTKTPTEMGRQLKAGSMRWDWNAKFFTPVVRNFETLCKPTLTISESVARDLLTSAQELQAFFMTSTHASDDAKDAVTAWYAKMVDATGLEIKTARTAKPAGFVSGKGSLSDDEEEEDASDDGEDTDISPTDLTDTKKMIRKLKGQIKKLEKDWGKLKQQRKDKDGLLDEMMDKGNVIQGFINLLKAVYKMNTKLVAEQLEDLKKTSEELDATLETLREKIKDFLKS